MSYYSQDSPLSGKKREEIICSLLSVPSLPLFKCTPPHSPWRCVTNLSGQVLDLLQVQENHFVFWPVDTMFELLLFCSCSSHCNRALTLWLWGIVRLLWARSQADDWGKQGERVAVWVWGSVTPKHPSSGIYFSPAKRESKCERQEIGKQNWGSMKGRMNHSYGITLESK